MTHKTQNITKYALSVGNFAKEGMVQERSAWVKAWVNDLLEKGEAASETQACTIISKKVDMSRTNIHYYLKLK